MGTTSIANPNGYQSLSTRNYMVYPYDNSSDSAPNNYTKYKGLLTSTYGYGDAILETSSDASNSWNSDYRAFVSQAYQFFMRGGYFNTGSSAGMFTFDGSGGSSNSCYGFRIILVSEQNEKRKCLPKGDVVLQQINCSTKLGSVDNSVFPLLGKC